MREAACHFYRTLACMLLVLLLAACGSGMEFQGGETARQRDAQVQAGSPVNSKEAALAAVHAHLSQITSCRAARIRLDEDFAAGKFDARLTAAYSIRRQNPVWEVDFAGDLHIPYVIWFVEQGDGAVLASISAATYYESPLLHTCRRA